ncbi:MAG TPA: hypothetical protein VGM69_05530 [Chloroflexota bacterium]
MIVDAHAHVIPREILRDRAPAEEWRPRLVSGPGEGPSVLEIGDNRQRNVLHEFVDPEGLLATFERFGGVRAAGLGSEDQVRVLGGSAAALFGL